jgi:hypothetical protein
MKSVAQAAAQNWYSGNQYYDYANGDTNNIKKLAEYRSFARMIWSSSTKVAFGMVDDPLKEIIWVVGYYCFDAPQVDALVTDITVIKAHVGKYCMVNGYNECYNKRALERHNSWRESHSGYVPLKFDFEIAKAIQTALTAKDFTGTI